MKLLPLFAVVTTTTCVAAFAPTTNKSSATKTSFRPSHLASSVLDKENNNVPTTVKDDSRKKNAIMMSTAIPFLKCPEVLVESNLAGNVGFDPLGFVKSHDDLMTYREAEIKHARLAMLAAAGWPLSEVFDRQIAEWLGLPAMLDLHDRVPAMLNDSIGSVSPAFWGMCLGMTAAIDLYGISKARESDPSYFPGKLGFDPLGLYPTDIEGRQRMELAEIKHGRLAMIVITGFAFQEYATNMGVVDGI